MESAQPGGRALAMAMAIGLVAACGDSAAQRCEDGAYCPEGTRCGSGAFCLVEEAVCGDFEPNAPCIGGAGDGFCTDGACRAGLTISGRLVDASGGGALTGASVTGVDRAWMEAPVTDAIGGFALDAVQNDTDLVLRVESGDARPPLRTRRLALGTGEYLINGNAMVPLRVPTWDGLRDLAMQIGLELDPAHGVVSVHIGTAPGNGLKDATATLDGPTQRDGLYFDQDGSPAPQQTATSGSEPTALFIGLEPGTYTLTADRELASECIGAGDDRPATIVLDVRAGEMTSAGWILCRQ